MKKKKPGFTLIEVIIALTLTVVILGITSSMFITGNKVFSDSDTKSTLQIEGQAIQEKISDIGMQATEIKGVTPSTGNSDTNEIDDILINSYYKTTEAGASYDLKIEKTDSGKNYKDGSKIYELWIDGKLISSNVKSVTIDHNVITAKSNNTLENINSIEFNILLRKEKGYSNIERPIDFRVSFRNKDN
jgi:prepilin-type N-terminal cleavage/methylation domain-containing protein